MNKIPYFINGKYNVNYGRNYFKLNHEEILKYNKKRYKKKRKHLLKQSYESFLRNKEHHYARHRKWRKTTVGKANVILGRIRRRCNDRKEPKYRWYGGRGIKCFLVVKDVLFLMKRDKFDTLKNPSIDRIKNDASYTRRNCRFIEQSDNLAKQWTDRRKKSLA